jgi:hypothetical protein
LSLCVEQHCKYKNPDVHKKEIIQKDNVRETEDKNKIIAQFIEENGIDDRRCNQRAVARDIRTIIENEHL